MIDVELRCLASDLPEEIVVDISKLRLDESIHLSQLKLPKGTELVLFSHGDIADHDQTVVAIHLGRQLKEEISEAQSAETAVLPKGKEAKGATSSANSTNAAQNNDKAKGRKS